MPNQLYIEVVERFPIALVLYNNKQLFIDSNDYILPVNSKSLNYFPVPIVNIQNEENTFNTTNASIVLIKYLFDNYNSMYSNISELVFSKSKLTLITDSRTKIFVNPNMIIDNIEKLKSFENSIEFLKSIDDHKYINLIYKNQIVVKERIYS